MHFPRLCIKTLQSVKWKKKKKCDENRKLIPERSAEFWHFENGRVPNPHFPLFQNVIENWSFPGRILSTLCRGKNANSKSSVARDRP